MSDVNELSSKALGKPLGGEYLNELVKARTRRQPKQLPVKGLVKSNMFDSQRERIMRDKGMAHERSIRHGSIPTAAESRWLLDRAILRHAKKTGQ